jgi:NAD(P)-dependent dehydrogenase (short-subunit alcohol dehydrogenase family)
VISSIGPDGRRSRVRADLGGGPPVQPPPPAALTGLVANAGVRSVDRRQRTADGFELTFGVNVLATHALVESLLPVLAPQAHVVLLGSGTHHGDHRSLGLVAPPHWQDPHDLARPDGPGGDARAGSSAHATSTLAALHQAHEWDRRHGCGPRRLRFSVYDPGWCPAPAWPGTSRRCSGSPGPR